MSETDLSEAIQDYLREIHRLEASDERATTSALAARIGVSASSVTSMLKKLAVLDLVDHTPYHGVTLTEPGVKIALEVIRHHRLLEQYLAETLGLGIDAVHAEADRLEHVLSEELEARIDEALGYPTHDPHGDPIPDAALNYEPGEFRPLDALDPGEAAVIERIPDGDPALLRYLEQLSLVPGQHVVLQDAEPFDGPLIVKVGERERPISRGLARQIGVGRT